jgi:hypothetical protein
LFSFLYDDISFYSINVNMKAGLIIGTSIIIPSQKIIRMRIIAAKTRSKYLTGMIITVKKSIGWSSIPTLITS